MKDRYGGLLPLVRMVRAIIPVTKSQSIHLLALPCDFMRQLRATIVLLLNLPNFITKQINFPTFEKLKSPYLISLHKSFTHRDTNFTRDFTVWTWTIAGETKQTICQLLWKSIKALIYWSSDYILFFGGRGRMEGRMMTSQCAQLSVGKLFIRSVTNVL